MSRSSANSRAACSDRLPTATTCVSVPARTPGTNIVRAMRAVPSIPQRSRSEITAGARSRPSRPPAQEILLDVVRPGGHVDLAGRVGPLGQALLAKDVTQTDVLRPLDDFQRQ